MSGDIPSLVGVQSYGMENAASFEQLKERCSQLLCKALNSGRLVAFVGAGVSAGSGYPNWGELAHEVAQQTLKDRRLAREPWRGALERALLGDSERSVDALSLLDLSQAALMPHKGKLSGIVSKILSRIAPLERSPGREVIRSLRNDLRIQRFFTTNYDREIEAVLREPHTGNEGEPSDLLSREPRSLYVDPDRPGTAEELSLFSIGAPGYEYGVLHCHGALAESTGAEHASENRSLVISRSDYRRVYLSDGYEAAAYRRAISLALRFNPVLLVGFRPNEPDLMRPLRRMLSQGNERRAPERPLFALMKSEGDDAKDLLLWQEYYEDFGLKVVFYKEDLSRLDKETLKLSKMPLAAASRPPYPSRIAARRAVSERRCEILTDEIKRLARERDAWWESWQRKPRLRTHRPEIAKLGDSHCYFLDSRSAPNHLPDSQLDCVVPMPRDLTEALDRPSALVIAYGRPGSGKGNLARQLAHGFAQRFEYVIHASFRFQNDFLSVVEFALSVLDPSGLGAPTRRLLWALERKRCLLILDGFDRLLNPDPNVEPYPISESGRPPMPPPESALPRGRSITPEVEHLLRKLVERGGTRWESKVVLMTSVIPIEVCAVAPPIVSLATPRAASPRSPADSEQGASTFAWVTEWVQTCCDECSTKTSLAIPSACSELRRLKARVATLLPHVHALVLTRQKLAGLDKEGASRWLRTSIAQLSSIGSTRRAERLVRIIVEELRAAKPLHYRILQRLSLFTTPIAESALSVSLTSRSNGEEPRAHDLGGAVEDLRKAGLVTQVWRGNTRTEPLLGVHTELRAYVLRAIGSPPYTSGEPHRFIMPGYARGWSDAHPTTQLAFSETGRIVDLLLRKAEGLPRAVPGGEDLRRERVALSRAALGMMRSRWSALSFGNLESLPLETLEGASASHLDIYLRRQARLLNVIRAANSTTWLTRDDERSSPEAEFFVDELAWIYNELCLISQTKGELYDAYALARITQELSASVEGYERDVESPAMRSCESQLALASIMIDLGNLKRAELHALRAERWRSDLALHAQAIGLLGSIRHLEGNFAEAVGLYTDAAHMFAEARRYRGQSYFLRFHAELLRSQGNLPAALEKVDESILVAKVGQYPGLAHYARLTKARIHAQGELTQATQTTLIGFISGALRYEARMGMPRLRMEALRTQAFFDAATGNPRRARIAAFEALGIATACGMRYMQASLLLQIGRLDLVLADPSARPTLEAARVLAESHGYSRTADAAEAALFAFSSDGPGVSAMGLE